MANYYTATPKSLIWTKTITPGTVPALLTAGTIVTASNFVPITVTGVKGLHKGMVVHVYGNALETGLFIAGPAKVTLNDVAGAGGTLIFVIGNYAVTDTAGAAQEFVFVAE